MQRFNINWTAKALSNQMEKGKVNYDNAVQRNLVWDIEKKSLLIHSMIYGYAIPAMYFTRDENGVYDSLDGKQRQDGISAVLLMLSLDFGIFTRTRSVCEQLLEVQCPNLKSEEHPSACFPSWQVIGMVDSPKD